MMDIFSYSLSYQGLALVFLVAFLIGMSKTGIGGVAMLAVPIMAMLFGGKASTGLMLPMLIMADLFAVKYYHRHANWHYLAKLFPCAAIGVVAGTLLGNIIDDQQFRLIMGGIIFASLGIMLWMEQINKERVPDHIWFAMLMGFLGGVTTMVGNLAGSVMALYLLSMRLPKNEFIGTAAWFFLVINLFKVPFHVFSWQTITPNSFMLNLLGLPFIALGAYAGIQFIKRISDNQFRWMVFFMTAIAALAMIF